MGHGDNVHLAHYRQHPVAIELGRVSRMLHQVSREKMDESPIQRYQANVDTETAGAITDKAIAGDVTGEAIAGDVTDKAKVGDVTEGAISGDFTVKAIADDTDVAVSTAAAPAAKKQVLQSNLFSLPLQRVARTGLYSWVQ